MLSWVPDYLPDGFTADRAAHLAGLEPDHFWFPPRHDLLMKRLDGLLPRAARQIVELGCGSGAFLQALRARAGSVMAVEGHRSAAVRAAARGADAVVIHGDVTATPLPSGEADAVVAFDVLEHVPALPFLTEARRLVHEDGVVLLSVPSDMRLWSPLDEVAGHRVRYDAEMLRGELAATGWRMTGHTHYQFLLWPLVAAMRQLGRRRAEEAPLERSPAPWMNQVLGAVNAFEVRALGGLRLPMGSSLVAWARAV